MDLKQVKGSMSKDAAIAANALVDHVTEHTQRIIKSLDGGHGIDAAEATFVAAMGAMGSLQILSALLGRSGGGKFINDNVNSVATLYSGILAAKMGAQTEDVSHGGFPCTKVTIPFGPEIFLEAMEACERVIGTRPDDHLNENFVRMVRDAAKQRGDFHEAPMISSRVQ